MDPDNIKDHMDKHFNKEDNEAFWNEIFEEPDKEINDG